MTTLKQLIAFFNEWLPKEISWDKDNTGLQVGDPEQPIRNILLTVDLTPLVMQTAINSKTDLIITHHPILFKPLSSLNKQSPIGSLLYLAIQNNIAIYTAHTNLDFIVGGVSTVLAETLGLQSIHLLKSQTHTLKKLEVYVPKANVDQVHIALSNAGAGVIGNYEACSFRHEGIGTFRGNENATPAIGKKLVLEQVEEVKLEMVFPKWKEPKILSALKTSHPYEEIAYQIVQTETPSGQYGMGAIGKLPNYMKLTDFLHHIKTKLNAETVRYSGSTDQRIETVAVCGGSGSELIHEAMAQQADCLVTADLKYHQFFEATETFSLIDAGHFETEVVILPALQKKLSTHFEQLSITLNQQTTNPIHYF